MARDRLLMGMPGIRKRPPADLARLNEAKTKLYASKLEPGELYAIVYGHYPVHPYDRAAQLEAERNTGVGGAGALGVLTPTAPKACKDCRKPVDYAGPPLMSQPARCLPCGKLKRAGHNEAARGHLRKSALEGPPTLDATPVNTVAISPSIPPKPNPFA